MNKIGKIFILIGIILISYSALSIIKNNIDDINAGKSSEEALAILETTSIDSNKEQKQEINSKYAGILSIPSLDLKLPILKKYTNKNLNISPCIYSGSISTKDLVICGHSYKSHFGSLKQLSPNDIIIFEDTLGNTYAYKVMEIDILSPTDIKKMIDSEYDLTIFTCTKDGTNRVTIRCNSL